MALFIAVLVNGAVILGMFFYFSRRIDRRLRPAKMLDEIRGEVQSLVVELNATTDRNITLLEDRISELKSLLDQADKRITTMKHEYDRYSGIQTSYADVVTQRVARAPETPAPPPVDRHDEQDTEEPSLQERVMELHEDGVPSHRIAQKVGSTIGEVDLIISLSRRGGLGE